ncbi:MAG TPA: class I SAM-dependent methyltransferase [Bryobacteraceae bacterium]|nr:class I SAM-dependent methyltransferase [Bryobacteraceae bacterium]
MTLPDSAPILDLIESFRRSKTMFTAVSMGIFDRLHDAPAGAADLAVALSANPDALERLLDGSAALGLLRKEDGLYHNQPVAEVYLRTASPHALTGYILYSDRALYPIWANLESAIREGTHRWNQTFGWEGPIFDSFFRTESAKREFLRGMHGFGALTSPKVVAAFDLARFHRLVDLGGASGHLAIAACERYPEMHGVVFDLPQVARFAREQIAISPAHARLEVIEGDFFRDGLPPADLYAVGQILHDWNDEKVAALLTRIIEHLPPAGALLIVEKLLHEDGVGPLGANMQSLNMLLVTEGKERTLTEYTRLLHAAGFSQVDGRRTGARLDAILAIQ